MARANAAYYASRDPFADFTTSPEITQVFGELLGLWAAVTWRSMGLPAVVLVEAGPGRGTLMADALRAIGQAAPDFRAALTVHLIETSPRLRDLQRWLLPDAVWHDSLETVPDRPMILLANEFFDALPIRQFVRRGGGWMERYVGPNGFVEVSARLDLDAEEGAVVERCDAGEAFARFVGYRLRRCSGAALILDYGPEVSGFGDSLQAISDGGPVDPLREPGTADLTAHVDFARLGAASGVTVHGPVAQGLFLARLGLFQRTNQLARGLKPREAMLVMEGARRLGEPERMGRLFKAMSLMPPGAGAVAGFEG